MLNIKKKYKTDTHYKKFHDSRNIEEIESCNICARTFRNNHGLLHLNFYRRRNRINNCKQTIKYDDNNHNTSNSNTSNGNNVSSVIESQKMFYWNLVAGSTFEKKLDNAYEKMVHCKNMFMLPSCAARKRYVDEVTRLIKLTHHWRWSR